MISRSPHAQSGRRLVIIAGLALSLFVTGCERDTQVSKALEDAHARMLALGAGDTLAPPTVRTSEYRAVIDGLRPVSNRGTASENAAAALLISKAQAGLAEAPLAEVSELEAQALRDGQVVRSLLSQWLVFNAQAEAAEAYDPDPELQAIQGQIQERRQKISRLRAASAEIEQRVADLREQAQAKFDESRAMQQEAGRLRQRIPNQTAVEGEETLKRAREISRRADALEVEAADLEARAEQLEPDIAEHRITVEGVQEQISRLEALTTEVQGRANRARQEASEARAGAAKIAQELNSAIGQLHALRSGPLAEQYDAAVGGYETAATTARQAVSQHRSAANLEVGSAQQVIGDLQWARAHGLELYNQLLTAMVDGVEPRLPQADQYRTWAEQAASARQAALEAATSAYEAARDAYQQAGAGDRMERVVARLNRTINTTSGGTRDRGAGYAPESGLEGDRQWQESGPRETLVQIGALTEQFELASLDAVLDLVYTSDPRLQELIRGVRELLPAAERIERAMVSQFGTGLGELADMASGEIPFDQMDFDPETAEIDVDGDVARVSLPDGETLTLREIGGRWMIDLDDIMDELPTQAELDDLQDVIDLLPRIRGILEEVAEDIESGRFGSPEEAMQGMMMRFMPLMMEMSR